VAAADPLPVAVDDDGVGQAQLLDGTLPFQLRVGGQMPLVAERLGIGVDGDDQAVAEGRRPAQEIDMSLVAAVVHA